MATMCFEQVQRFILAKKGFWDWEHFNVKSQLGYHFFTCSCSLNPSLLEHGIKPFSTSHFKEL